MGYKLQKFANLGVKFEKNRVKSIKICTFWWKSFPKKCKFFILSPHTFIWQNIHLCPVNCYAQVLKCWLQRLRKNQHPHSFGSWSRWIFPFRKIPWITGVLAVIKNTNFIHYVKTTCPVEVKNAAKYPRMPVKEIFIFIEAISITIIQNFLMSVSSAQFAKSGSEINTNKINNA